MRLPVVLLGWAALIGLVAPAHADPDVDASFIGALNNAGITYQNPPSAVAIGRRACELMDQGHSEPDVVKSMTAQNAGFSTEAATKFTHVAEDIYCPQHIGGAVSPPPPQPSYPLPEFPWPALPGAR